MGKLSCSIILDADDKRTKSYLCDCIKCPKKCVCDCHDTGRWGRRPKSKGEEKA